MAISDDDVARVRQATDLVDLISTHTALRKVGRQWMGLCPFHGEKTASFSVNGELGLYRCHGCQVSGDAITFVREYEHVDFAEAVERLAARANIELKYDTEQQGQERKRRKSLTEAMTKAVEWYHERLLSGPDARAARGYLRERGYDGDVVRQFKIGWAPEGWDELARALKLPERVMKEAGLAFVNRAGRQQDAFRGRVLFPIFDPSGQPVAFGGRVLPGGGEPKYKNSSETPIYNKSRTLYGLNWAKGDVVDKDEIIVCEGYTDVIAFFRAGMPRAVATCGTALTEENVRQIRNFAKRVVLAYDADKAGQAAAERFYEWERKLGIEIRVAKLPKGSDPADAVRKDPAHLTRAVEQAVPYLGFRVERALESADLRSPEGRVRAADNALAMIAEHPNELLRDEYVMHVSGRCDISPDRLRAMLERSRSGSPAPSPKEPAVIDVRDRISRNSAELRAELDALSVAIHQPEDIASLLGRILPEDSEVELGEILFTDAACQAAFRALLDSATFHEAVEGAEPEAAELLTQLAVNNEEGGADAIFRLVDRAASRELRALNAAARDDPAAWAEAVAATGWLKLNVERLRSPLGSVDAAADLLAWMSERSKGARTRVPNAPT